jgi:probable HAF family extracellular repeat protein
MFSIGSVGQVRRGILASPTFVIAPLLLLAAACGSGMEPASPKSSESAALSSSSKHGDAGTQYTFQFFDPPGSTLTMTWGINDYGVAVGTFADANGVFHGFSRRGGAITVIDPLGSTSTVLGDINDFGAAVGWFNDANGMQHAFKLAPDMKITVVDFPGAAATVLIGINDLGDAVGSYGPTTDEGVSFLLRNGKFISLPDAPGAAPTTSLAFGINDLGTISGTFGDAAGTLHGFVLRGTHYKTLDAPNEGSFTAVAHINDLGNAIGFNDVGSFIVDTNNGVFSSFSCPDGRPTLSRGINNRGQVAGGCLAEDNGPVRGFIATPVRSDE